MGKILIFTDGGARGNPGPAAIGVLIKSETGKIYQKISQKVGKMTNNLAEYQAVVEAWEWLKKNREKILADFPNPQLCFFLDSALVVNQLNGLFKVKDARLREFLVKVRILESETQLPFFYQAIPREKNREADFLVKSALGG